MRFGKPVRNEVVIVVCALLHHLFVRPTRYKRIAHYDRLNFQKDFNKNFLIAMFDGPVVKMLPPDRGNHFLKTWAMKEAMKPETPLLLVCRDDTRGVINQFQGARKGWRRNNFLDSFSIVQKASPSSTVRLKAVEKYFLVLKKQAVRGAYVGPVPHPETTSCTVLDAVAGAGRRGPVRNFVHERGYLLTQPTPTAKGRLVSGRPE